VKPLFTVIRGGDVYTPAPVGRQALVLSGERIVWIGSEAEIPRVIRSLGDWCDELEARDCLIVPGLVDPHQHLAGGGGEQGFASRTPEVQTVELVAAGITSVIGCLGTDVTTRHLTSLLAKTRQLEAAGLSAYMLTGGFTVPPKTITGAVDDDLVIVDKVIGVGEVAISDRRACDPSLRELARLVTQAYRGGTLSGKAGRTLFHVGDGKRRLHVLQSLLDEHDVAPDSLVVDHANRSETHVQEAIALARRGVHVCMDTVDGDLPRWLRLYRESGGPSGKLSVCSDAHTADGAVAKFSQALVDCVTSGMPLADVLPAFTSDTAAVWQLSAKGALQAGHDADLLFLDRASLHITRVVARGRVLGNQPQVGLASKAA
jgi:beta-aspartyl-dipeptidase (metallo-type)